MIQLFREAINIINITSKVIDVSLLKDMPAGIIDLRVILTRMSGAEGENRTRTSEETDTARLPVPPLNSLYRRNSYSYRFICKEVNVAQFVYPKTTHRAGVAEKVI